MTTKKNIHILLAIQEDSRYSGDAAYIYLITQKLTGET